jgi:hypothetical protein
LGGIWPVAMRGELKGVTGLFGPGLDDANASEVAAGVSEVVAALVAVVLHSDVGSAIGGAGGVSAAVAGAVVSTLVSIDCMCPLVHVFS